MNSALTPRVLGRALPMVVVLAFWPVWRWYVLRLSDGSDEPWGLVALCAGCWFLRKAKDAIRVTPGGVAVAGSLLVVYAAAFGVLPPLIRAVMALLILAFLTGTLARYPAVWGLFLLSLPIVASLQFYLGYPLRLVTAAVAQGLLSGIGVARQGTQLVWEGQVVGVDAPCSGIQMLWVGMFLVLALAAFLRFSFRQTLFASLAGFLLILVGNALRATLLFVKESGMVNLPEWTHQGIGLLVFAGMIALIGTMITRVGRIQSLASQERGAEEEFEPTARPKLIAVMMIGFVAAAIPAMDRTSIAPGPLAAEFPGWPEQWRDHWLEPLPLTEQEQNFAQSFPGQIGVFAAGPHKLIFRWVTQPTRKLHSSADCLRASGFLIQTERPGTFIASLGERQYLVEESIYADRPHQTQTWKEVSAWFWSASFSRTSGPWWAVTAIQPVEHLE